MHSIPRRMILICLAGLLPGAAALCAAERLVRTPAELREATGSVQPGDVVHLAAGEWRDMDLVIECRGTADAPITFCAERPGETIVRGQSRLRLAGEYVVVSGLRFEGAFHPDAVLELRRDSKRLASYCRVTGCAFLDCNPPGESKEDSKYVSIYGHDNRLDHCVLSGKRSRGTTLVVWLADESSGRHQLDHNLFGPRPELKKNGGETIRIGDSNTSLLSARCLVESNLFVQCDGEAEIISNKSCENTYRHNTFRGCSGALTLRHGHRCTVEGNWFFGEGARGTGGVRVIGEGHRVVNNYFEGLTGDEARAALCVMNGIENGPLNGYSPVVEAVLAFNTFVDCKQPLLIGFGDEDVEAAAAPRRCTVANNLIIGRRGPFVQFLSEPFELRAAGNLLIGPAGTLPGGFNATPGETPLEQSAAGWWQPPAGSTALGVADRAAAVVETDIEGQPRAGRLDIGCDQVSAAAPQFHPLQAGEVGPDWLPRTPAR